MSAADPRPVRTVSLLGSTGSIGTQAIQVIRANRQLYRVVALTAGGADLGLLAQQAVTLRVDAVGVAHGTPETVRAAIAAAAAEAGDTAYSPEILVGPEASRALAARPVVVCLNGMAGASGLEPTLAALRAGSTLAPVSYTHLDVYKRQVVGGMDKLSVLTAFADAIGAPSWFGKNYDALTDALRDLADADGRTIEIISVSYTHLDVYKRQGLHGR